MKHSDKNKPIDIDLAVAGETFNSRRAWFSIGVIVILMILSQIDRNSISLLVDPVRASLGINDFQIGLLQGPAFAVFFLVGSLLMGWMIDKYSTRWLIYIGVTVWSAATIASGLAGGFIALMVARCFVGLGESVLQPAGWSMVARLFPARKLAMAIGVLTAGAQVGVAVSFMLVGFLVAEADQVSATAIPLIDKLASWQFVFIVAGLPGVFLAFLIFLVPKDQATVQLSAKSSHGGLLEFMRKNRAFLTYHFLGFGILSIMVHGAAAWAPTYLMRMHGIDVKDIGVLVGLIVIPLGVGGAVFAGWLVDRSFQKGKHDAHLSHFGIRCAAVTILGGAGFIFDSLLIFTIICFGLIQFIQPFSGVAGASLQISTPEQYRGRISGIFIMFYNALGLMLGPSFVAFLSDSLGSDKLGIAIALNYMLFGSIAALLLWIGRRHVMIPKGTMTVVDQF